MLWPYRENRAWVYGHRGVRHGAPENTLLAFEMALDQGADGIEFDVQVSRDGKAVVFHDSTLERMTGSRDCRSIAALAAEEACSTILDQGAKIPSLPDVLRWAEGNRLFLNVELKCTDTDTTCLLGAVERDISECASASLQQRLLFSSFSVEAVREVTTRKWPWLVAQLLGEGQRGGTLRNMPTSCGLHPHFSAIEDAGILCQPREHFVNVWTVNDPAIVRRLEHIGVDGIITDAIELVIDALR